MKNQYFTATVLVLVAVASAPLRADGPRLWRGDVEEAFRAARATHRLLLVDAAADWCGWCKVLEREVFPDPAFLAVARDFELLRIDVEDGGAGTRLAAQYGADSLPLLLVLEPNGARVGEVRGYAPVATFVSRLKSQLAVYDRVLENYRRTLDSNDGESLRRTAVDFYERRDGARAAVLLERLLEVATLRPGEETWVRVLLADSWRLDGNAERARDAAARAREAALRAGPLDEPLAEKLDLLAFWVAETAGECGSAAGALDRFEHQHPHSLYLAEARLALDRLRTTSGARCS